MLQKVGFAVVVLGVAHASLAQSPRVSAPISDISYEITADSSAVGRRQLGVAMSFTVGGTAPVVLALPAWSPGHYTLLWFVRKVANFAAMVDRFTRNGSSFAITVEHTPLAWRHLDYQTWQIVPPPHEA